MIFDGLWDSFLDGGGPADGDDGDDGAGDDDWLIQILL